MQSNPYDAVCMHICVCVWAGGGGGGGGGIGILFMKPISKHYIIIVPICFVNTVSNGYIISTAEQTVTSSSTAKHNGSSTAEQCTQQSHNKFTLLMFMHVNMTTNSSKVLAKTSL